MKILSYFIDVSFPLDDADGSSFFQHVVTGFEFFLLRVDLDEFWVTSRWRPVDRLRDGKRFLFTGIHQDGELSWENHYTVTGGWFLGFDPKMIANPFSWW